MHRNTHLLHTILIACCLQAQDKAKDKRRKKERKEKKEKKKRKEEKKGKKHKKHKKEHERGSEPVHSAAQELPPSVYGGVAEAEAHVAYPTPQRTIGMQRPEEAAAEHERAQRVHRVFDPELGVSRCAIHKTTVQREAAHQHFATPLSEVRLRNIGW